MTTIYRSTYSIDIKGKFLDMNMSEASARLDSLSAETRGVFATLDELHNFHVREYNRSIDNFKSLDIPYIRFELSINAIRNSEEGTEDIVLAVFARLAAFCDDLNKRELGMKANLSFTSPRQRE